MNLLTKKSKIFILIALALCALNISCKVNNNMFDPKIYMNRQIPTPRLQTAAHHFSIQSSDPNYQISGDVYQSRSITDQSQIYNISNYKKSESCTYFKSVLQMDSLQGQNLNFMALQSIVSEQSQQLFVIGVEDESQVEKRFLKVYSYGSSRFQFQTEISFQQTKLSQNIDYDILMTQFKGQIFVSDGNYLYKLQNYFNISTKSINLSWSIIQGFNIGINFWNGEQFLGFKTVVFDNKTLMLLLYTEKIVLYDYFQQNKTVIIHAEIQNNGEDPFEDVQIGENNTQIYILSGNKMHFYSSSNFSKSIEHQLAGELCTRIYFYKSTLHIICEYEKRNFVAEYFYNDTMNVLVLNRFYNEIENYRILEYINNYFLMIGQNDIIITSNGVNRKILMDMPKKAYSQKFISFGIQNLHQLSKLQEPPYNTTLLAVGQDFIVLFKLKFVPAEVWCYIQRPPPNLRTNILIVRNTSICEFNQQKQTLKSICQNLTPVELFFQHYEIQSRVATIFVVIVVLLIFVVAFLCLGCVFRQNMNYNNLVGQIKSKIKKIKSKPSSRQLKQI